MKYKKYSIGKIVLMAGGFILIVAGLSALVMWLWNAILPDLLGINEISYWQALGLLVLCKILFGGFGGGCQNKRKHGGPPRRFRKKWRNMDEEERQKFKEEWKKRCDWRK
jgi:hypothetical protein